MPLVWKRDFGRSSSGWESQDGQKQPEWSVNRHVLSKGRPLLKPRARWEQRNVRSCLITSCARSCRWFGFYWHSRSAVLYLLQLNWVFSVITLVVAFGLKSVTFRRSMWKDCPSWDKCFPLHWSALPIQPRWSLLERSYLPVCWDL